ncbi:MAG: hypothetical protein KDK53_00340 [Maritimibacter sp.]|nr:hypothetical protein [Maritimibacter sp.]
MKPGEIDRICSATLQGRFGPGLMSPKAVYEFTRASSASRGATITIRDGAVWTTAVPASSKGSCK